jgi:hypothetical protein
MEQSNVLHVGGATAVAGVALALLLGGCADDGNGPSAAATSNAASAAPTDVGSATPDDELCALVAELFELEGFPSIDQLERYQKLAPRPIAEAAKQVTEALIAVNGDPVASFNAFADDDVEAAEAELLAFETETCGTAHSDATPLPAGATRDIEQDATRVDVNATDYAFHLVDVEAGPTSFVLSNDGSETHVLEIVKLADGITLDQALQANGDEGTIVGQWQTNLAAPGDDETITFNVEPGNYALVCFIPTADGTPHLMLGMHHEFTVQ